LTRLWRVRLQGASQFQELFSVRVSSVNKWQLLQILYVTGAISAISAGSVRADISQVSVDASTSQTLRLSEMEFPRTNAEWLSQDFPPTEVETDSVIQITGVRLTPTTDGVEVVLETAQGEVVTPTTEVVGDALIAEISNAVLALPDGEAFEQFNPAPGIGLVRVTSLPGERVQVSITGTEAPPTAQVRTEAGNLVLSVVPGMMPEEAEEVEEIELIVTATRTAEEEEDIPRSVTVVTREQIEEQSQLTTNIQDIISWTVPGFGPPNFRAVANTARPRGRAVQVLIDGVPVTSNYSITAPFTSITPGAIEQIEVVRGPTATFGGGATGGVINIITRRPSEEELTATVEARVNSQGDFAEDSFGNYLGVNVSGNVAPVDYVFNFSTEGIGFIFDGEGDRVIAGSEFTYDTRNINVLGKLGVNIGENQRLQFSVNHVDEETNEIDFISDESVDNDPDAEKSRALPVDFECIDFDCENSRTYTTLSLNYNHDDIFGSQLRLQGFYRNTDLFFGQPFEDTFTGDFPGSPLGSFFVSESETEVFGGRLEIETPFSEAFNLLWGADYNNDTGGNSDTLLEEENDGVFRTSGEVLDSIPFYTIESLGLFAQAQWQASSRWQVSGGVRYENIGLSVDDYTQRSFVPQPIDVEGGSVSADDVVFNIGTVYDLTDKLSVFASFAQGFGVPEFAQILSFPPDGFRSLEDDLEFTAPQVVNNYELGIRGQWQAVQFSLAGFFNQSDLGTTFISDDDGIRRPVRAPERFYGVEATVDWQPSDTWQLGGLISWNEGESDIDDDGDFEPFSSRTISPLKITAYVENETLPGWRNRLQALYVGNRERAFEAGVDRVDIESYFVLDYISSIDIGPGSLQIGIQNLLDTQYFPPITQFIGGFRTSNRHAAPGRSISIGYRATF
jgi:iron complex outermembrane receptor protein